MAADLTHDAGRTEKGNPDASEALSDAISHLLEECRMVLPGIQALFGFQWVAFFNQRFTELTQTDQDWHLAATAIVAISAALLMTPAAYHRTLRGRAISVPFTSVSTRLILAGMFCLSLGVVIDFFVIASFVILNPMVCMALAVIIWLVLFTLWFLYPLLAKSLSSAGE